MPEQLKRNFRMRMRRNAPPHSTLGPYIPKNQMRAANFLWKGAQKISERTKARSPMFVKSMFCSGLRAATQSDQPADQHQRDRRRLRDGRRSKRRGDGEVL